MKIYDLIIIGAGPAGMSAAIYAKRAMLEVLVLEKEAMSGGQIVQTYEVDNYPGLPKMTGMDLGDQFYNHASDLGAEVRTGEVSEIRHDQPIKEIVLKNGEVLKTKTVMLATESWVSRERKNSPVWEFLIVQPVTERFSGTKLWQS